MDQEKTYKWIQDRLRELNAGTIAEADFHQLETLAKDDPFIADALEGYQQHPDLDHTEYLDSLAQKIKPYKRERRRWLIPNLTVTAVAASLILIVGFYAVMTKMSTNANEGLATESKAHALTIEKSGDTVAIVPDQENSMAVAEPNQPAAVIDAAPVESSRPSTSPSSVAKEKIKAKTAPETSRSNPADETIVTADTKTMEVVPPSGNMESKSKMNDQPAVVSHAAEKENAGYSANQVDTQVMAQPATRRVTTTNGQPLIDHILFIEYLKKNSKYPLADHLNSPAKTVTLEFEVNTDSHPSQIKVTTSSGDKALDDEAVRLIRKGPDWQCEAAQYPCKVKYSIYFRA